MTTFVQADISAVTERLWVGGRFETGEPALAESQIGEAAAAGLTHIVDLRAEKSDEAFLRAVAPHIDYSWLGIDDAGQVIPDDWWRTVTDRIGIALAAQRDARVLVHCNLGINRGPSAVYAALLTLDWDPIDALDQIRAARPGSCLIYAEGALDWWLRQTGAVGADRAAIFARTDAWRSQNRLTINEARRLVGRRTAGAR